MPSPTNAPICDEAPRDLPALSSAVHVAVERGPLRHTRAPRSDAFWQYAALVAGTAAVASLALLQLARLSFVDPDIWHGMALAREIVETGRVPMVDSFAYTPTIRPVVHHEWGSGMVLYAATSSGGAAGLMLLKYVLLLSTVLFCIAAARRGGAQASTILSLAPLALLIGAIGMTTVRAQLYTLLFLAVLLYLLERDRAGDRRWIWAWLPVYVVWLNLHAGFVVGVALFGCHACEQLARRRPIRHLVVAGAAMIALVAANPYGWHYYGYLARGVLMERPLVTEWAPLWQTGGATAALFVVSLAIVAYATWQVGPKRLTGLLLVAVAAYAAARHTRHVSIYAVVWASLVPSYVAMTPLGAAIATFWRHRARFITVAGTATALVCLAQALPARPWHANLPTGKASRDAGQPVYPVGAVNYLRTKRFRGNLMVPFVEGGFCLWKLHPDAKVSFDGRYEACYQRGVFEENVDFYRAQPGWRETLTKYPTDAVLVPRQSPIASRLAGESAWRRVYRDDLYELYARPGLELPVVDRKGELIEGTIP